MHTERLTTLGLRGLAEELQKKQGLAEPLSGMKTLNTFSKFSEGFCEMDNFREFVSILKQMIF